MYLLNESTFRLPIKITYNTFIKQFYCFQYSEKKKTFLMNLTWNMNTNF